MADLATLMATRGILLLTCGILKVDCCNRKHFQHWPRRSQRVDRVSIL